MESVAIEIPRSRAVRGGDRFEIFGDGRTGVLDISKPLTDRPIAFWDGLPGRRGHLLDGHLSACHLDNVIPDGHLAGRHLYAEHLWPAAPVMFISSPLYFGVFGFSARTVDAAGNASAALSPIVARLVNSSPRFATGLTKSGFDETSGRLTLTFERSPDL